MGPLKRYNGLDNYSNERELGMLPKPLYRLRNDSEHAPTEEQLDELIIKLERTRFTQKTR